MPSDKQNAIDKENQTGIEILSAMKADRLFDFACLAGIRPGKRDALLEKHKGYLKVSKSFAACCVHALLDGARQLWKLAQDEAPYLNKRLIDPAFDAAYEGIQSYIYKTEKLGWSLDYTPEEEITRSLSAFLNENIESFGKGAGAKKRYLYSSAFSFRTGKDWGSLEYFGGDVGYMLDDRGGALSVKNYLTFDMIFNRYWTDGAELPSKKVLDMCVEFTCSIAARIYLPVKYFYWRHSSHSKAESCYNEEKRSRGLSCIVGERRYTRGINKLYGKYEYYPGVYAMPNSDDVYTLGIQKRTPWEQKIEDGIQGKNRFGKVMRVLSWVAPPILTFLLLVIGNLISASTGSPAAFLIGCLLSYICAAGTVYRFSESIGWSLLGGGLFCAIAIAIINNSGILSWLKSIVQ